MEIKMAILKEKYKKEIIDKLPNFSELQIKEILNFVNYLEKENKKRLYQKTFNELQSEFQEKLTIKDALKEIEDYRSGK